MLLGQIHTVTGPFFALALCGFLAARRAFVQLEAIAGMHMFVR